VLIESGVPKTFTGFCGDPAGAAALLLAAGATSGVSSSLSSVRSTKASFAARLPLAIVSNPSSPQGENAAISESKGAGAQIAAQLPLRLIRKDYGTPPGRLLEECSNGGGGSGAKDACGALKPARVLHWPPGEARRGRAGLRVALEYINACTCVLGAQNVRSRFVLHSSSHCAQPLSAACAPSFLRRTLFVAVALLSVAALATAHGAARAQDDGVDTLAEGKPTESPHAQGAVPVDKPVDFAVHKPRPGQRDQRLVAREEQAKRMQDFQQRQVASPVRVAGRSSRRLLEAPGKTARKGKKTLGGTHRKHAWQMGQMRGNQSPEHRERESLKGKSRRGTQF